MSSTPETEWDETEQGWILGLAEYRAGLCRHCGQPLTDTTDAAHDPDNPANTDVYDVPDPVVCLLCEAFARKEKAIEDRKDLGVNPRSFHYHAQIVHRRARIPKRR